MANTVLQRTLNNVAPEDLSPGYAAGDPNFGVPGAIPRTSTMTIGGSARAALVLFAIIVAAGTWSWLNVDTAQQGVIFFGSLIAALVLGLITTFRPQSAPITAPLYAVAEGVLLGMISRLYENAYDGVVLQAILATSAIAFVMYTLYSTRIIKVTPRFQRLLGAAVMGAMIFYGVNLLMSLIGVDFNLVGDTGPMGIAITAVLLVIATLTLASDFDFIEKGAQAGLPKYMNWAAAYGLVVSVVWIYLEVLRLLGKTRQ